MPDATRLIGGRWPRCCCPPGLRAQLPGPPRVIDGDALELASQRVRRDGIDAPELDQLCQHARRDYPCGRLARAALWDLVAGLDVSCAPEDAAPAEDRSILATCTTDDLSVGLASLRRVTRCS